MLRAYKYELKPTDEQKVHLNQCFGNCRFIFNLALETKIQAYSTWKKNISAYDLMKQLTELKQDLDWLNLTPIHALQHSISHLDAAFLNFFKGRSGFPKFKSKHNKQSFHIPAGIKINFDTWQVFIPKFKWVQIHHDRTFSGTIRNATISKSQTGRYFISILTETGKEIPEKKPITQKTTVGIDVGLKHFATLSDGTKIDNPKFLFHSLRRLRIEQRTLSRRFKKGAKEQSINWQKQKIVVAKLHEKIANQRKDFLHKTSTAIIKQYDMICMENLNISGMVKNRSLSRAIADVAWGTFESYVKYKSDWYGKNFMQIGRFEPSSKTTSCCGAFLENLTLSDRIIICPKCGMRHDRDLNAANNIKTIGLRTQPLLANAGQ